MNEHNHTILERLPGVAIRTILMGQLDAVYRSSRGLGDDSRIEDLEALALALSEVRLSMAIWHGRLMPEVNDADFGLFTALSDTAAPAREAAVFDRCLSALDGRVTVAESEAFELAKRVLDARQRAAHRIAKLQESELGLSVESMKVQLSRYREEIRVDTSALPRFGEVLAGVMMNSIRALTEIVGQPSLGDGLDYFEDVLSKLYVVRLLIGPVVNSNDRVVAECDSLILAVSAVEDVQTFGGRLSEIRETAGLEPSLQTSLDGLLLIINSCHAERVERLETAWPLDRRTRFLKTLRDHAQNFEFPEGIEIERKYLLRALPPHVRNAEKRHLWQGYLPGEKLIERIRRIQSGDEERYIRTVKLGSGVSRIEVEELCSEDTYHALWALTETRRVEKIRYRVIEGERIWEVDDFCDRSLVLAEIELSSSEETVEFPSWLEPYVVGEVTHDSTYINRCLAQ